MRKILTCGDLLTNSLTQLWLFTSARYKIQTLRELESFCLERRSYKMVHTHCFFHNVLILTSLMPYPGFTHFVFFIIWTYLYIHDNYRPIIWYDDDGDGDREWEMGVLNGETGNFNGEYVEFSFWTIFFTIIYYYCKFNFIIFSEI